jgi:hypothetical protein
MRADRAAAGLTEGDQIGIPGAPIADRQDGAQRHFGLERCACPDQPEPVADAVDVDINADRGFAESERNDQVGGLASDPRQLA